VPLDPLKLEAGLLDDRELTVWEAERLCVPHPQLNLATDCFDSVRDRASSG